jgi:hypothetical protein
VVEDVLQAAEIVSRGRSRTRNRHFLLSFQELLHPAFDETSSISA